MKEQLLLKGTKLMKSVEMNVVNFLPGWIKRIIFNVKSYNVGMDDIKKGVKKDVRP